MSLRARLTLIVMAAFSAGLLVLGVLVPKFVGAFLTDKLDQQLESGQFLVGAVAGDAFGDRPIPEDDRGGDRRDGPAATFDGAYVEVRLEDGTVLFSDFANTRASDTYSAPDLSAVELVPGSFFTIESADGNTTWRVHVLPEILDLAPRSTSTTSTTDDAPATDNATNDSLPRVALVALPTDSVTSIVSRVVKIELAASGGLLLVLAGSSWALIGLGLRPLRRMEQTAATISSGGDLHQRLEVSSERTELGRLGATLNEMLGRLEGSFEAQQQSERRLRRFIADASHELRTPLTSIRGYAELHRRGMKSPEQADRGMERIESESVRMSHLVEDLLALARLDERAPLDKQPFDLGAAVNDLVEDARVVEPLREIAWTAVSAPVVADRLRLMQAVANLISNVRMHTEPDTPVDISVVRNGERVIISVADHGAGIPPEQMSAVFDRFFRSDESRARPTGGAGLGLSIVAAVAKAHDGRAWAEHTPGGGATFKIEIAAEP